MTPGSQIWGAHRPGTVRRMRVRLAADDGVALVLAIIVVATLSILAASAIELTSANIRTFGRDQQSNRALNVAEAGLNNAVATLRGSGPDVTTLPHTSGTLDGGTWSYDAVRSQDDPSDSTRFTWTVTSTGVSPNGDVTRIVRSRVAEVVTSGTTTTPPSPAYGYSVFLGDPNSDCTMSSTNRNLLEGSAQVTSDTYVAGSLCISGGGSPMVAEPATSLGGTVTLYVGNKLESNNNSSPVALSSKKLKLVTAVNGCWDGNHSQAVACSKQGNPTSWTGGASYGSGVWANSYSSTQVTIPKPTIDTAWYANAKPGPSAVCNTDPTNPANTSTFPNDKQNGTKPWSAAKFQQNVFDSDSTRNTSISSVDFLQLVNNWNQLMNSFDCRYYDSSGNLIGRFAWTYPSGGMSSSNPGSLIVQGTVFIDGNLNFASSDYAVYQGSGTIYANGTITITAGAKICAQPISGSPCQGNYDASANDLELVAVNAQNQQYGFNMTGAGIFEGTAFTNGAFHGGNGSHTYGPIIADTAIMDGAGTLGSPVVPPDGAPGAGTTQQGTPSATWSPVAGSWEQLR